MVNKMREATRFRAIKIKDKIIIKQKTKKSPPTLQKIKIKSVNTNLYNLHQCLGSFPRKAHSSSFSYFLINSCANYTSPEEKSGSSGLNNLGISKLVDAEPTTLVL